MARRRAFLVVAYMIHREYGGPEEGGWWYDAGERIRVLKVFPTSQKAWEYAGRFNARTANWGVPLYRTGGYGYRAMVYRDRAPKYTPTRQPRYS